ncbi:MAG: hypothetical protein GY696_24585 [Gammaproteobacteria bacterium]|nr:hypothetical protein [Gammaproteobacteria bacterium]
MRSKKDRESNLQGCMAHIQGQGNLKLATEGWRQGRSPDGRPKQNERPPLPGVNLNPQAAGREKRPKSCLSLNIALVSSLRTTTTTGRRTPVPA